MKIVNGLPPLRRSRKFRREPASGLRPIPLSKFFDELAHASKLECKYRELTSSDAARSPEFAFLLSQLESALVSGQVVTMVFIRREDLFQNIAGTEPDAAEVDEEVDEEYVHDDELFDEEDYDELPKDGLDDLPTFFITSRFWSEGQLTDAIRKAVAVDPKWLRLPVLVRGRRSFAIKLEAPPTALKEIIYIRDPDTALSRITDKGFLDWPEVSKRYAAYNTLTHEVVGGAWRSVALAGKPISRMDVVSAIQDYMHRHFPENNRLANTRINELATLIHHQFTEMNEDDPIVPNRPANGRKNHAK